MKKLPIGLQSIQEVIEGGYAYVDKTAFAKQLIDEGKYYFMARPRRFGKSLFISTLKEIFKGNKALFNDCSISKSDYPWTDHPVIHIDFTQIPNKNSEDLEKSLKRKLTGIAESYQISIDTPSLQEALSSLVIGLSQKANVVFLVDEYDKPITDNLSNDEIAAANRDVLRGFFGTLKGLDQYLKFVFITGVSKFAQVSLFSGFNNLQDLTVDPQYSTLMGYTREELEKVFGLHVKKIAKAHNCDAQDVFAQIKEWYNGYCFSENCQLVFNPFSTLSFLRGGLPRGYWFSSGTPSFLIEQVRDLPFKAIQMSSSMAKRSELLDIIDMGDVDLNALMWQTGYLTIKGYDPSTDLYKLDFPNREVREAFFDSLLREFAKLRLSDIALHAKKIRSHLCDYDLELFFKAINVCYAKIPYHLFTQAKEGFYHAVFLSLLEGIGFKTRAEDSTNIGRADLVVETDKAVFIFELKVDQNASIALEQAELKNYCEKYTHQGRNLVVIGINFSTNTRNISDWTGKLFNPTGIQEKSFSNN